MVCECSVVEIDGEQLKRELGRVWNLGPILVSQDKGSNLLSLIGTTETFEHSFVTLSEFKQTVMSTGVDIPFTVKISLNGDKGPYGFDPVNFNDIVMCRYKKTSVSGNRIELVFEMLGKGKELNIFNGNGNNGERTGDQKPLFWASILKGNLH